MNQSKLACGIMSGTSLDGIDVVIATISGTGLTTKIEMIAGKTFDYPPMLLEKVKLAVTDQLTVKDVSSLHFELGRLYASCVISLCKELKLSPSSLNFIASHGQTVYHQSKIEDTRLPSTLQLGSGSVIAGLTETTVVSDFRIADMIQGGQGAPLVPYVDYLLLSSSDKSRIAQNIGGISNITYLPKTKNEHDVYAFDTGPGNMMINYAMEKLYNKPYDDCGQIAKKGQLILPLYDEIMQHPFVHQMPPKSCGREQFGGAYTQTLMTKYKNHAPEDIIHTLTVATASTMISNIKQFILNKHEIDELIISGGGVHNQFLMNFIQKSLPDIKVLSSDDVGLSSDYKEALAFIVLGNQTLFQQTANLPSATGAKKHVVLGTVSYFT